MPKRSKWLSEVYSTKRLTSVLILIGGVTIGVDLFFLSSHRSFLSRSPTTTTKRLFHAQHFGPEELIRHELNEKLSIDVNADAAAAVAASAANQDGKEAVILLLQQAGIPQDELDKVMQQLPTMKQVIDMYGNEPVIYGLETCSTFRSNVPELRRMLGAAGMFSTGTNLLTHLLKRNCYIPARFAQYGVNATKEQLGMRWQVPWGKHTDPGFRNRHAATHAQEISKNDILPVVTIRNVWTWMQSMCHHPYAAQWEHYEKCPHLKVAKDKTQQQQQVYDWNNVTVTYGAGKMSYQSLVHLWNDWYSSYMNPSASYPLIMIRMEDLVFHTESTISQVCACAGGQLQQPFQFVHDSAKKDSPGHDTRTGYVEAWIKYGKPMQVEAGFDHDDYQATMQSLSRTLMDTFSYQNPPSSQG